ncbi:MAG: IS200/IS605 family transposase [Gemmatimonadetes bacterium]|nr:IS200/IS605 family transposase [Gemmatimonadota bacterium]MYB57499.1 IS200/IS605 family transposase [Gemmatimonadota bacterium]
MPALQYPHNAVYSCHYHVIWCTKYRRSVLNAQMQARIKDCIHEKQEEYSYIMQECEVLSDHVHLLVSIPPSKSVNQIIGRIKGYTAHILRSEFPELKSRLPSLWTRSKFVATCGGVTLEVLKRYVENQKGV